MTQRTLQSVPALSKESGRGLRSVLLIVALIASVLLLWFSLAGLGVFDETFLSGGELLQAPVTEFQEGLSVTALILLVALASGAAVGSLIALLPRPGRKSGPRRHVVVADELGFVLVDTHGVEAVACAAALRAPGVLEADVEAEGAGGSPVRLAAVVGVHPGASIEEAGRSARKLVREAVESLVGLRVSDVVVSVRVLDPEDLGRGLR